MFNYERAAPKKSIYWVALPILLIFCALPAASVEKVDKGSIDSISQTAGRFKKSLEAAHIIARQGNSQEPTTNNPGTGIPSARISNAAPRSVVEDSVHVSAGDIDDISMNHGKSIPVNPARKRNEPVANSADIQHDAKAQKAANAEVSESAKQFIESIPDIRAAASVEPELHAITKPKSFFKTVVKTTNAPKTVVALETHRPELSEPGGLQKTKERANNTDASQATDGKTKMNSELEHRDPPQSSESATHLKLSKNEDPAHDKKIGRGIEKTKSKSGDRSGPRNGTSTTKHLEGSPESQKEDIIQYVYRTSSDSYKASMVFILLYMFGAGVHFHFELIGYMLKPRKTVGRS